MRAIPLVNRSQHAGSNKPLSLLESLLPLNASEYVLSHLDVKGPGPSNSNRRIGYV